MEIWSFINEAQRGKYKQEKEKEEKNDVIKEEEQYQGVMGRTV